MEFSEHFPLHQQPVLSAEELMESMAERGQRMLRAGCLGLGYNRWLRPKMEGLTQNLAISSFRGTHDEKTIENIGIWGLSAQVSEAAAS
jgi:hypothetical protein